MRRAAERPEAVLVALLVVLAAAVVTAAQRIVAAGREPRHMVVLTGDGAFLMRPGDRLGGMRVGGARRPRAVAALGDGETFYLATDHPGGGCQSVVTRVTPRNPAGEVVVPEAQGRIEYLAVSPEGRRIAYVAAGHGFDRRCTAQYLWVRNLVTGNERMWTWGDRTPGYTVSLDDVAWSSDGRHVVYRARAGIADHETAGFRVLDTTGPQHQGDDYLAPPLLGSPTRDEVLAGACYLEAATYRGDDLVAAEVCPAAGPEARADVVVVDPRTGRVRRRLFELPTIGNVTNIDFDRSGRRAYAVYLDIESPTATSMVRWDATGVRAVDIAGRQVRSVAW